MVSMLQTNTHNISAIWKCPTPLPESLQVNLFSCTVEAGFPSPAEDHIESTLDINELLIDHPAATFFVRVSADILIVDRSKQAVDGSIVVALVNGEYTVKRLSIKKDKIELRPENSNYKPIRTGLVDSRFMAID